MLPLANFPATFGLAFVLTLETLFVRGFILKNSTRNFQNSPPPKRSACLYVTISENFERFQYFNFEKDFWKTKTFFKKLLPVFSWKHYDHFHTKLPYQKPMYGNGKYKIDLSQRTEFCQEPLIKSWFDVSTTQIPIFIFF